jgi:predicted N-acyltransferase
MAELQATWHRSLADIEESAWDRLLAETAPPFYRWRWLRQLEASGSIVPREGWQPCHLSLARGEELIAVAPLYLKGHSYGEFVFDQSFAQLAGQLGLGYYPKLVGMSPVSPVQGYRFWFAPDEDPAALTALLLAQIDDFCRANGIPVYERNFTLVDTYSADEAFLTGTFGAQTPVGSIDGRQIGSGQMGPMTERLRDLYKALVAA